MLLTLLIAAAKVTKPDGIKGINLPSKIKIPTFLPSLFTILSINSYFPSIFPANLFIPFLYTLKLIHPPITSPNKEIKNPFIGPKNTILAPVTNTEGTIPSNAIITLINKLINIANSLY